LKRSFKTKLPRYNDDDDVEQCQYVWQENELAQLTLDNGCCCWWGRGVVVRGQAAPAVQRYCWLITAQPHRHTPSARSRAHTFGLEFTASTVNDDSRASTPWDHGFHQQRERACEPLRYCIQSLINVLGGPPPCYLSACRAICCYGGRRLNLLVTYQHSPAAAR